MFKLIKILVSIGVVLSTSTYGMEKEKNSTGVAPGGLSQDADVVVVVTKDQELIKIPRRLINHSQTLKKMVEDACSNELALPIDSKDFNVFVSLANLAQSSPEDAVLDMAMNDLPLVQLGQVLNTLIYLDCSTILDVGIKVLTRKIGAIKNEGSQEHRRCIEELDAILSEIFAYSTKTVIRWDRIPIFKNLMDANLRFKNLSDANLKLVRCNKENRCNCSIIDLKGKSAKVLRTFECDI